MSQLTAEQQRAQVEADRLGRVYVTRIDGRVAIILPPDRDDAHAAKMIARVAKALESLELS